VIRAIKEFRKHVKRKVILVWDNFSTHTSAETKNFLKTQKKWLIVERFPAYTPELNPLEYLWSVGKNKDFACLYTEKADDLDQRIRNYKKRIKRRPDLLTGFLKKSTLFNKELSR
jgi:transposase